MGGTIPCKTSVGMRSSNDEQLFWLPRTGIFCSTRANRSPEPKKIAYAIRDAIFLTKIVSWLFRWKVRNLKSMNTTALEWSGKATPKMETTLNLNAPFAYGQRCLSGFEFFDLDQIKVVELKQNYRLGRRHYVKMSWSADGKWLLPQAASILFPKSTPYHVDTKKRSDYFRSAKKQSKSTMDRIGIGCIFSRDRNFKRSLQPWDSTARAFLEKQHENRIQMELKAGGLVLLSLHEWQQKGKKRLRKFQWLSKRKLAWWIDLPKCCSCWKLHNLIYKDKACTIHENGPEWDIYVRRERKR